MSVPFDAIAEAARLRSVSPPVARAPRCAAVFDHRWHWRALLPERKGEICAVVARGRMNAVEVAFADGTRTITSRYAVRQAR